MNTLITLAMARADYGCLTLLFSLVKARTCITFNPKVAANALIARRSLSMTIATLANVL